MLQDYGDSIHSRIRSINLHRRLNVRNAVCRSLLVLFVVTPILAAPVPKEKAESFTPYTPMKKGDSRVYEIRSNRGEVAEYRDIVTQVETKAGVTRVYFDWVINGKLDGAVPAKKLELEVSDKGVFRRAYAGTEYDPPMQLLKFSAKSGDKWEHKRTLAPNEEPLMTSFILGAPEDVEVPAGKFKAVPVTSQRSGGGRSLHQTHWYAPNVGLVKEVTNKPGAPIETTWALKSFTPGK